MPTQPAHQRTLPMSMAGAPQGVRSRRVQPFVLVLLGWFALATLGVAERVPIVDIDALVGAGHDTVLAHCDAAGSARYARLCATAAAADHRATQQRVVAHAVAFQARALCHEIHHAGLSADTPANHREVDPCSTP